MGRLVTDRLNHLFNKPSGVRRMRNCQDHSVRFQDDIQRTIHVKYNLTGVFVDLEKAFDLMWTGGFLSPAAATQHHWTDDQLDPGLPHRQTHPRRSRAGELDQTRK